MPHNQAADAGCEAARRELRGTLEAILAKIRHGKAPRKSGTMKLMKAVLSTKSSASELPSPPVQCAALRAIRCVFDGDAELQLAAMRCERLTDPVGAWSTRPPAAAACPS